MAFSKKENIWQIPEAKAHFSEMISAAQHTGVQIIEENEKPVAVLLSKKDYDKLLRPEKSLLEFFKEAPCPEVDLDLERSKELLPVEGAIQALKKLRKGTTLGKNLSIKKMIEEGRS